MAITNIKDKKIISTPPTPQQTPVGKVASKSEPLNFSKADKQTQTSGALNSETPQTESKPLTETEHSSVKESAIEKEINIYIEENNLSSMNIDDLRAFLLNKKNKTPKELDMLAKIQAQFEEAPKEHSVHQKHEPLVSVEEMLDSNWIKKDGKEKMSIIADKYFEKTDENYKNLSTEEKSALKQKQMETFANDLANKNDTKITKTAKASGMFEVLNDNDMTIEDYNKLSKEEKVQLYRDHQANVMKSLDTAISNEVSPAELLEMEPEERLQKYAEIALEKNDPNFRQIKDPEKRKEYISAKMNEIVPSFKDAKPEEKKDVAETIDVLSQALKTAKNGDVMSFDEYLSLDFNQQLRILKKTHPDMKPEELITKNASLRYVVENGKIPSSKELREYIENSKEISSNSKNRICKALKGREKNLGEASVKITTVDDWANKFGQKPSKFISKVLTDIDNSSTAEAKYKIAGKLLEISSVDGKYTSNIIQELKARGISEEFIKKQLKNNNVLDEKSFHDRLNDDGVATAATIDLADYIGDKKAAKSIAQDATEYLSIKSSQDTGVALLNSNSEYSKDFSIGVNNNIKDPVTYSSQMLQRDDLSESGRARFTKSVVETAPTPERQKAYAKELSSLGYESVNEGLAAASKSVDKSVRSEYNSYVQDAIKNYPPEKQAAIQNAMKTGEISQETLAKTTVSASETSNASKSQVSQQSSSTSQSVATNSKTVSQSGSKSQTVSAQATVSNVSSKSTTKTSVTQSSVAQDSKALQQKKDALVNKIVSYETTKAEKTIEREKAKAEKAQTTTSSKNSETTTVSGKQSTKSTESQNAVDKVENLEFSEDEQNTLKEIITDLFQQNSVSAAYSQINDEFKDKFMQTFATQGKESDVISFANDYKGNPDTIVKLINYCNNDGLKLDLTRLLPLSRINEIISSGKLSSNNISKLAKEGKVDNKILMDYLKNNRDSMTYDQIKEYMKYMPLDYSSEIYDLLKAIPGSPEWEEANNNNMKTAITSNPESNDVASPDDGIAIGSNKIPMRGQYDKMKRKGPFYLNA